MAITYAGDKVNIWRPEYLVWSAAARRRFYGCRNGAG